MYKNVIFTGLIFIPFCGCAIHPAPKDVMPRNTIEIIDHIKCEARFAIIEKAADKLLNNRVDGREHEDLIEIGRRLKEDPEYISKVSVLSIPGKIARDFYARYINATIAFGFSLVSFEDNSNSTEIDFASVLTNGMVSVPLSASNDQMRQSTKTFLVTDTFKTLIDKRDCILNATAVNFEYPVSGSIGLNNIISTFIDLNEEKDLSTKSGAPDLYADALIFTTTTVGGIAPKLVLSPPTKILHLTGAAINTMVTRKDTDTVNIGLALPKSKDRESTTTKAVAAINRQRSIQVQNSVIQFFSSH